MSSTTSQPPSPPPPSPPAPVIGKIGPYTVFLTPPSTPNPSEPLPKSPIKAVEPILETPKKVVSPPPPPVRPPPAQFDKPADDRFGFIRSAVTKVQNAHSSLDEYMANWLGLDQSKYQWALNDYFESKEVEKGDSKIKEVSSKTQNV